MIAQRYLLTKKIRIITKITLGLFLAFSIVMFLILFLQYLEKINYWKQGAIIINQVT